jgi:hypothetical protein
MIARTLHFNDVTHRLLHAICDEIVRNCEDEFGRPPQDHWQSRYAISGAIVLATALGARDPDEIWHIGMAIAKTCWNGAPRPVFGRRHSHGSPYVELISQVQSELAGRGHGGQVSERAAAAMGGQLR